MLNKGLHSEEARSWKTEVIAVDFSQRLTEPFRISGLQPHFVPGINLNPSRFGKHLKVSPAIATQPLGVSKTLKVSKRPFTCSVRLAAYGYEIPQKQFAYETGLTNEKESFVKHPEQLASNFVTVASLNTSGFVKHLKVSPAIANEPLGVSETLKVSEKKSTACLHGKQEGALTLSVLRYPYTNGYTKWRKANFVFTMVNAYRLKKEVPGLRDDIFEAHRYQQTQTTRINKTKTDQLVPQELFPPWGECPQDKGVTNIKNTFCDFEVDKKLKLDSDSMFMPCKPGARISPHFLKGESPDRKRQGRGFELSPATNPVRKNRTVLTKN